MDLFTNLSAEAKSYDTYTYCFYPTALCFRM